MQVQLNPTFNRNFLLNFSELGFSFYFPEDADPKQTLFAFISNLCRNQEQEESDAINSDNNNNNISNINNNNNSNSDAGSFGN